MFRSFFFLLIIGLFFTNIIYAQKGYGEKHIEVSLRMIGHQFLQKLGDSTSRVLPITKSGHRYKIEFEKEFEFVPNILIETINSVVKETEISKSYIVEIAECNKEGVVYSYEIDSAAQMDMIPCSGRKYPKACYNILLTLKKPGITYPMQSVAATNVAAASPVSTKRIAYVAGLLSLLLVGVFFFIKNRKLEVPLDPYLIAVGQYFFDKRNATLTINSSSDELSGKEAELLLLLIEHANETIERDEILNKVWGDEGDYIGRTLDVFISKLRKKLEADPNVKIVNIRGVGYKLVVDA